MNGKEQFAQRLNEALDRYGAPPKGKGRQLWVGKRFNVSQKAARKWLEGEGFPKTERILQIARKLCASENWLLNGIEKGNQTTSFMLETDEEKLLKLYRELPPSLRETVVSLLQGLTRR